MRRIIRQKRRALNIRTARQFALSASRLAFSISAFKWCKRIGLYMANDGEIDPQPLFNQACRMKKTIYLPVLHPWQNKLWFVPYSNPMRANRFGIFEPIGRPVPVWTLDILILPLVAFDEQGHRLGMGGGYYDRSLAYLKHRMIWRRPRLWGYAYELQKLDLIQAQPWDIPLQRVITEKRIYAS